MRVLGVELSDAGVLVAGGRPARLLETDQNAFRSPGYALPQKKEVLIGRAAERVAHLYPQHILNHFWDQLSTEPVERPVKRARNLAEVSFAHFKKIWARVSTFGDSMVIAVPDHYTRTQLGLLLAMAQELGVRVLALTPLSVAAVTQPGPGDILLHLDIHLHRMALTCLKQAERLYHIDSLIFPGKGLLYWQRQWVDAIAREFVHATRFDPLHRAETEQSLYNRLDGIAAELKENPTAGIELRSGQTAYRAVISADQLLNPNSECLNELYRAIRQMRERWATAPDAPCGLIVSHRVASLPGVARSLAENSNVRVSVLRIGAGATGALAQWDATDGKDSDIETVFQKSKPWFPAATGTDPEPFKAMIDKPAPSHILLNSVAYPMGEKPLTIARDAGSGKTKINPPTANPRSGGGYCRIRRQGGRIFLDPVDLPEATVNGQPISGHAELALGDVIRLDNGDGTTLRIITCLKNDES